MVIKWWPAAIGGLAAGLLLAPAGAARANNAPETVTRTSAFNAQPVKRVTVTCPGGTVRYAGGGAVNYGAGGGGGVALTGIVPDHDGESVTVTAAASPGHGRDWSVTARAICETSVEPWRITGSGAGTATATCPEQTRMFGLGFQVAGAPSAAHVREIALAPDLTGVRVTAGGPAADAAEVTAIALCRPAAAEMRLVRATTDAAGWPKVAARKDTDPDLSVYATGATVTGPAAATLDAVMPGPDGGTTWARGTLAGASAGPAGQVRGTGDDPDGSVTVEAELNGTFH
jgi:hypothetical protein